MAQKVQIITGLMHLHKVGTEWGEEEQKDPQWRRHIEQECGLCKGTIKIYQWAIKGLNTCFHPECVSKEMKNIDQLIHKAKKQAVAKSL